MYKTFTPQHKDLSLGAAVNGRGLLNEADIVSCKVTKVEPFASLGHSRDTLHMGAI